MVDWEQGSWVEQDRKALDDAWVEDMAWIEREGGLPPTIIFGREGLRRSFERRPLIWTLLLLAAGAILMTAAMVFLLQAS